MSAHYCCSLFKGGCIEADGAGLFKGAETKYNGAVFSKGAFQTFTDALKDLYPDYEFPCMRVLSYSQEPFPEKVDCGKSLKNDNWVTLPKKWWHKGIFGPVVPCAYGIPHAKINCAAKTKQGIEIMERDGEKLYDLFADYLDIDYKATPNLYKNLLAGCKMLIGYNNGKCRSLVDMSKQFKYYDSTLLSLKRMYLDRIKLKGEKAEVQRCILIGLQKDWLNAFLEKSPNGGKSLTAAQLKQIFRKCAFCKNAYSPGNKCAQDAWLNLRPRQLPVFPDPPIPLWCANNPENLNPTDPKKPMDLHCRDIEPLIPDYTVPVPQDLWMNAYDLGPTKGDVKPSNKTNWDIDFHLFLDWLDISEDYFFGVILAGIPVTKLLYDQGDVLGSLIYFAAALGWKKADLELKRWINNSPEFAKFWKEYGSLKYSLTDFIDRAKSVATISLVGFGSTFLLNYFGDKITLLKPDVYEIDMVIILITIGLDLFAMLPYFISDIPDFLGGLFNTIF